MDMNSSNRDLFISAITFKFFVVVVVHIFGFCSVTPTDYEQVLLLARMATVTHSNYRLALL